MSNTDEQLAENETVFEEIDEIIRDEYEKSRSDFGKKPSPESERQNEAVKKISEFIVDLVIKEPLHGHLSYFDSNLLLKIVKRVKLNNHYADLVFWRIEDKLNTYRNKYVDDPKIVETLTNSIEANYKTGVRYFEDYLVEEFKNDHVTEIVFRIKRTLSNLDEHEKKYLREALLNIKKNTEERIELRKEQKLNREQMYEPLDYAENQGAIDKGIVRNKDLTIDRAILLMKHLAPRLTGCDQNKVAEVIAFLIGSDGESVRQNYSLLKNKFLNKPKAFQKDVKIVSNYLRLIGLTDEVKKLKDDYYFE